MHLPFELLVKGLTSAKPLETWSSAWAFSTPFGTKARRSKALGSLTATIIFASFGVDDESCQGDSFTSDVEILKGELAGILYNVTKDDVSYIFGDMVESLEETETEVRVHFAQGTPTTAFDLVVAADGISSKIRSMAFGSDSTHIKSLNTYVTYFSIPHSDTDTMWSRSHWITKGRNIMLRPDRMGTVRAFKMLSCWDKTDGRVGRLEKASKEDTAAQKALDQDLFQDGDWEIPRILKGMNNQMTFICNTSHKSDWIVGRTVVLLWLVTRVMHLPQLLVWALRSLSSARMS